MSNQDVSSNRHSKASTQAMPFCTASNQDVASNRQSKASIQAIHSFKAKPTVLQPEKSFLSIIYEAAYGSNAKYAADSDGKLDEIIPNFVSKHVRNLCYQSIQNNPPGKDEAIIVPTLQPSVVEGFAAVVMVDVSGYSKLTALLAERGAIGAELLSKTMKSYFDQIIKIIIEYGGDIVKFAGDAVILCWKSHTLKDYNSPLQDIKRGEMVWQAARCCLKLLTDLGEFEIGIKDCDIKTLRIHLGIGAGKVYDMIVGGHQNRWEHFIAGEATNQLSQVLDLAKAGELALSHHALRILGYAIDIRTLNLGTFDKRCILLNGLENAERKGVAVPWEDDPPITFKSPEHLDANILLYKCFMDRSAVFKLQADVNQSKLFGITPNLTEMLNMAELRQVTTVFIKLQSLNSTDIDTILAESQKAIMAVLYALHRFEGSLRQFHVDDKGAVILCFFGLPPLAHDNDAKLGMEAALEIKEKFSETGMFEEFAMGVTTGVVSYGGVGTNGRAEYAVMGDAINMAARLMCLDDAKNTILCDERTYNLCSSLFKFKTLGDKFVKGKSSAIAVFQLTDYIDDMNSPIKDSIEPSIFIGRSIERKLIEGIINDKEAKCLLFEADGGQGLTSLANFLLERLDAENITSWYMLFKFSPIKSTQSDRSKPFFLIHTLMWKLIDIVDTCKTSAEGLILPQRFAAKRDPFVSSSLSTREWLQPGEEQDTQTTLQTGGRRPSDGISSKRPSTAAAFGASAFRRKSLDMPIGGAGRKSLKRPDELSLLPAIPGIRKSAFPLAMPDMAEETYLQDNMAEETYLQDNISSGFYDGFDTKAANLLTFDKLIYNVMRKLGMQTKYYHILCEINETFLDDNDTEVASRLRGIAISEVILICLDHLSRRNKFALVLSDFQYSDIHSIEIIDKILNESCKVCIFFFCRPGWTYESEDTNALIVKMKQSSRLKESKIEAFSLEDTSLLVLEVWANPSITTVNQKITESILNRTSGNPFFIKSLAIHMKESGQWRISPMGELQPKAGTLDNDNLALGYDNQGIILGHFDRIDRNLQLFLKVAAVLGLKWSLDDVLFFITGIMNLSAKVDNICYTTIINGITTNDRYGFIRTISTNENDTGAWFSFKSPIIRKCIYTLMAQKQRQQVHLFAAQYYESKLTEFNKQKYLIKIMEHYSETDATQLDNKFLYYRMVAKYYYDHGYSAEAVVYYRILLQITETYHEKAESDLIMSSWYREYGESLFYRGNMSDAYLAIIKSLQLMNFYLPEHGIHFFLKLRSLKSNWMKLFETSFLDNAEAVDYSIEMLNSKNGMDSVPYLSGDTTNQFSKKNDRYSSGNVLSKSVIARASIVGSIPDRAKPAMNVSSEDIFESGAIAKQHALQILAEIFLHQREYDYFTYVIMYAVTLYTVGLPTLMMARILSLASLMVAGSSDKPHDNEYAKKCMQWAFILDDRADLQTSLLITNNKGILCFLMGQLGQSLKYLHISSRISRSLCNLPSQFKALRLRCAISFLSIGRKYCEASAHEMIALSQRYEIWEGKFWGLFHVINVLFLEENSSVKLQDKSKELEILWNDGPQYFKTQPLIKIAYLSLHASLPLFIFKNFMNEPGNLPEHLKEVPSIFSAIQQLDWEFVECIKPLIFGFFAVLSHKKASAHSSAAIIIHKICELINDLLKKLTGLKIRHNLRTIFKGLSLLACGKHSKAVAAWKKGLDANSECLWHQGVLLVSIGHFGSQVDDVGSMDAGRKLMKTLYCSNFHSVLKRFS